jgi:hypothetical protein
MNPRTATHLKRVDAVIRRIRFIQSECSYSSFFDQAIEALKLAKIQIQVDGENRDRYESEKGAPIGN